MSLSVSLSNILLTQNSYPIKFISFSTFPDIDAFDVTINADLNKIASKIEMHSTFHKVFFYSYGKSGSKYPFNFPHRLFRKHIWIHVIVFTSNKIICGLNPRIWPLLCYFDLITT